MVDTPLSQAPATQERVLHDARAVLDVSEFDVTLLTEGSWVVVRLVPAPHSGSATGRGAFIEGGTGRPVDASGRSIDETSRTVAAVGQGTSWYAGSYET